MARFVLKTWNCFGAAQTAAAFLRRRGAPDNHRFGVAELVETVHQADVLCLQELFLTDAEAFFDSLSHPHKVRDFNVSRWWPPTFGGSGLGIASRFPIILRELRPFDRPHLGTERFARKGMLHARVQLDDSGLSADVVTTHMQSGYGDDAARVRRRQIAQLRAFVDEVRCDTRPFILCGDLNIDGLSPSRAQGEYGLLREALSDFEDLGAMDDHATFHPDPDINELAHRFESSSPRQRIDYVFFRPPKSGPHTARLRAVHCALALRDPYVVTGRGRTFASDHFAVKAVFEHP